MNVLFGDPASTSALGGALRGQAIALADLVADLEPPQRPSRAGQPAPTDVTTFERNLIFRAATELDQVGGLLQAWTTLVTDGLARVRALADEASRAGLEIDGRQVVESLGPSRIDATTRAEEKARLQELLNRVTAGGARELQRMSRELERSTAVLARLSDTARTGP